MTVLHVLALLSGPALVVTLAVLQWRYPHGLGGAE